MKRAIVATARAAARPAMAVLAAGLLTLAVIPPSLATASPILNAQEGEAQPPNCSGCGGNTVGGPTASGSVDTVGGSLYDPARPETAFAGQHVTLSESAFPYADGYTPVAQALVQEDGTFEFTVHPEQETHYVVTWPAGGLVSSPVAIAVVAAVTTECSVCGLKKHGNGPFYKPTIPSGAFSLRITYTAALPPSLAGRTVYLYLARNLSLKARLAKTFALHAHGSTTVRLPAHTRSFIYRLCYQPTPADGLDAGREQFGDPACGAPVMQFPRHAYAM
jgi:hypothetical protein